VLLFQPVPETSLVPLAAYRIYGRHGAVRTRNTGMVYRVSDHLNEPIRQAFNKRVHHAD